MTSKNILSKSIIPDAKNINNLIYAILDIGMVDVLEMGLKGNTKIKFMAEWDYRIFARIIRLAFEAGKCSSPDEFDERVNAMFDNQDLIRSIINDIQAEDRKL